MGTFQTWRFNSLDNIDKKKMRAFGLLASALSLVFALVSGKF